MISRGIPTSEDAQWGCFEKDQAEALASLGHKIIVFSVDSRFRLKWRKIGITECEVNGVKFINLFLFPSILLFNTKLKHKFRNWQFLFLMRKVVKKYGLPEILYSHFYHNTSHAVVIKNKYHIPLVGIEHAALLNNDNIPYKMKYKGAIAYNNTDAIISVSKTLSERIKFHFNKDSYVVYNAIGSEFKYWKTEFNNSKLIFITVGTLEFRKGFDLLVPAFKKANLPKEKWEMRIIGSGKEHINLQKQIIESNLDKNIFLLGRKNKNEIVKLLNESNVFILPSRNENFSVAVLEALACGLPVISSICGGIKECISDINGMLFPVDDVDGLAKAIVKMYSNYQFYDRMKISEDCQNRFSASVIANDLTNVFENVLK